MDVAAVGAQARRPRFRRAAEPPPFRLTDDDVEVVRVVARHRLIRSTHIAALIGRSLDRTNDRLMRLFHAGYIDRPRAQLDRFPSSGSAHYIYALAAFGLVTGEPGETCTGPIAGHPPAHPGASSSPRRAVDPSVAGPPFQHRVRPINCFEECAHLNLIGGFDVIAIIKKMASVEGHKVLRL